ncbi:MAG: hypothetical protein K6G50_03640, partial [bacterium]|nr:hypothetical protein [bacterium]
TANISSQVPNEIQSCHSDCVIVATGKGNQNSIYAGGIIGMMGGGIANCSYSGRIFLSHDASESNTASNYVGGICGSFYTNDGNIINCSNNGKINVAIIKDRYTYTGGICGAVHSNNNLSFSNLENSGDISVSVESIPYANVSGSPYVATGGVLGDVQAGGARTITVDNCKNYGKISSSVSADISSWHYVGGITAYLPGSNNSNSDYSSCYNFGDINLNARSSNLSTSCGGMIGYTGYNGATIAECANYGNISGTLTLESWISGISSYGKCVASRCINVGNINVSCNNKSIYAAGIAVQYSNEKTTSVNDCLNVGSISAEGINSGSVCGIMYANSILSNCLNIGKVTSQPQGSSNVYPGAIFKNYNSSAGAVSNNYYLEGNTYLNDTLADRGNASQAADTDSSTKRITNAQLLNSEPVTDEQILTKLLGEGNWQTNPYEDDELGKGIKKGMPVLKWMEPIE